MTGRPTPAASLDVAALRSRAASRLQAYVDRLAALVAVDSGSGDAEGIAKVAASVADELRELGLSVSLPEVRHPDGQALGPAVVGHAAGDVPDGARVLLVGHLDTVFEPGTAAVRPFAVSGSRALGPGVSDDKGGVAAGVAALELLRAEPVAPYASVTLLLVPDEEIGSPGSRPLLESLARQADAVLCLECSREDGSIVSARKGAVDLVFTVQGRAAHAGIEPERGVNAAVQAAHLVVALEGLSGLRPDVTVNVGVVQAGTRPNVVADQASVVADARAATVESFEAVIAAARRLTVSPQVPGASVQLEVRGAVPPMERSAGTAALASAYAALAARLGLTVRDVATGGVADANVVAALGVPVLDGLGPVGGNDHSVDEWLDLDSVPERVALLAALVAAVGSRSGSRSGSGTTSPR